MGALAIRTTGAVRSGMAGEVLAVGPVAAVEVADPESLAWTGIGGAAACPPVRGPLAAGVLCPGFAVWHSHMCQAGHGR